MLRGGCCRVRHREALSECSAALKRYRSVAHQPDLAAEELRSAGVAMRRLTGGLDTESVLDALFGEFCIGK